jgi:hypothetical protein
MAERIPGVIDPLEVDLPVQRDDPEYAAHR